MSQKTTGWEDIDAVSRGGPYIIKALQMDVTDLCLPDVCFDVVTMLEVLEHIPDY